jgi:cell division inhibitor SepF
MSLMDKFKDFVGLSEDEDDDEYVDMISKKKDDTESIMAYESGQNTKKNKVVNIHATTQLQVVLVKPDRFDSATEIADHLNEKRTVVLNLESANKDTARRLIDFLCGVAYANGGKIQKVANSTFIITPYNVDMMGEILDELENNGMFF